MSRKVFIATEDGLLVDESKVSDIRIKKNEISSAFKTYLDKLLSIDGNFLIELTIIDNNAKGEHETVDFEPIIKNKY